ncbi:polysaccharide biosynthesis/export family protein [Nitrobacter sp. JJSN]|uniref:polysaccharide biosynthesis/export family protein n=1 Tax=Nitrobacter sp. JJSN TaxID=3453033 RepID=UPI003F774E62
MDRILIQGNGLVGGLSGGVVQKALAGNSSPHDQPQQIVAGYAPPTVSPPTMSAPKPDTLIHVAADASAVEPGAALSGEGKASDVTPSPAAGLSFGVGDKLKIAFYERVNVEEDKWGRATSAMRGIQQRPELSGEYTVQEDGTVSIPLLGSIAVAARSAQQVHAAIDEAFENLLGRQGMVNVVLMERAPIYVLGPVKNPGSFKYVPGATVLHAIAMAGGVDRGASDPWSKVEAVREIQKRSGAADSVVKLIARDAVLKAERDGAAPKVPLRLMELVGATAATRLVNEQSNDRKAIVRARKDRKRAIKGAIESAKQDILEYGHTTSLDKLVKTRQERVDNMHALMERNVIAKSQVSQVEAELADAEQRRQDAINQFGMAKQRLAALEAEGLKVQADLENDVAVEIEAIERQIADNERELSSSEGVLRNLSATSVAFTSSEDTNGVSYQIVRRTTTGPVNVAASGMTLLQPGDLVNIVVGTSEATGLPAISSVPSTPAVTPPAVTPHKGLPAGSSASNHKVIRAIAQD